MNYKPSDFSKMIFDPFSIKTGRGFYNVHRSLARVAWFKELPSYFRKFDEVSLTGPDENIEAKVAQKAYKDWLRMDCDYLLKFVVLVADSDLENPLRDERDFESKAKIAIRLLKLDKNKHAHIFHEIDNNGMLFQEYLFQFFRIVNKHDYEVWFSLKMQLHSFLKYLRDGNIKTNDQGSAVQDINSRMKLASSVPDIKEKVIRLEEQIFNDRRLEQLINERSANEGIGGYAEQYAQEAPYYAAQKDTEEQDAED